MKNIKSKRINLLGLPLNVGVSVQDICALLSENNNPISITFINPFAWAVAKNNSAYLEYLDQTTYILSDGQGVTHACQWLTNEPCQRISFDMSSLAGPFLKEALLKNKSIILAGSKSPVALQMKEKLEQNYPGIIILDALDGYGPIEEKVVKICAQKPDIVIVGMGAPRQEAFMLSLQLKGFKGLAITCGGFFDQYLEDVDYYPKWVDTMNLRFLFRLYKEPKRLWKRYLIDYQIFIKRLLFALLFGTR